MLSAFGFDRLGVVLGDLYFVDPNPNPGQEGPERGVRLELRVLERRPLEGSIYSAQPILVGRPVWRVDLLESADGPAGSFDRTHHHPAFTGWEPGSRHFVEDLSADPLGWLGARLRDLGPVLSGAGVSDDEAAGLSGDVAAIAEAADDIVASARRLLDGVHAGRLGRAPEGDPVDQARVSWL